MHHAGTLAFLIVPALLLLWSRRDFFGRSPWPAAVVAALFAAANVREALANVRAPREWDFGCFWLYGHIARAHLNVYDPAVFARFARPFATDRDFVASVIDVGFPYPPPSIALFLPLGGIDGLARGLALWYALQAVAFVVAVWLLQRAFFRRDGARGALLVAAVLLALPSLASNTAHAQTNLVLLDLAALAFLLREAPYGSWAGALAIWVKPFALALLLADVAAGRLRRVAVALATIGASLALSVALVGPQAFATYLRANPSQREPSAAFTEAVNQSLFATLARASAASWFPALALGLTALAAVACARYRRDTDLCFALALQLGLLLYPGTLESYGIAVIVPLFVLWSRRDDLPLGASGVAALASVVVALQGPLHASFVANVLLYAACGLALAAVNAKRPRTRTSEAATVGLAT